MLRQALTLASSRVAVSTVSRTPVASMSSVSDVITVKDRTTSSASTEDVVAALTDLENYKFIHWTIPQSALVEKFEQNGSNGSSVGSCRISLGYSKFLSANFDCTMTCFSPSTVKVESLPNDLMDFSCVWDIHQNSDPVGPATVINLTLRFNPKSSVLQTMAERGMIDVGSYASKLNQGVATQAGAFSSRKE